MRKLILAAALLAGTAATPAFAQDAADTGRFSGVRVEGIVGYETTKDDGEGRDGIVYGVGAGYDIQSGNLVFGVSGEASKSNIDECTTSVLAAGDELCVSAGRDLTVGGRVGVVAGSNALLYAHVGYTNARIDVDYTPATAGGANPFEGQSSNLDGVRVGGGAEIGIGRNAFAKAEYRYSNYEQGFDRHQVVGGFGLRF
ncbi:MAG TPA: outer membrane beta-barrel protein [Allosphingosinicella sp.]|nr:outer membrane beta-barrel protein [Allosphingosinicella sp.]